jgi:hypothetical protein
VASISEIVSELQAVLDSIDSTATQVAGAGSTTEEIQGQMAAADMQDKVAALAALKDTIDELSTHIAAGKDLADNAITQAHAIGSGT